MRKRINRVYVHLDDDELNLLNEKVNLSSLSREEFLRRMIAGVVIKELPPVDFQELLVSIRKIGSNVNQLVRYAHIGNSLSEEDFIKLTKHIRSAESLLLELFM